jgi:hypothetical protein
VGNVGRTDAGRTVAVAMRGPSVTIRFPHLDTPNGNDWTVTVALLQALYEAFPVPFEVPTEVWY